MINIVTIIRDYIAIINSVTAIIGVNIGRSTIISPLVVIMDPNNIKIIGYGHNISKLITSLPMGRGDFLYLITCYNNLLDKEIYRTTEIYLPIIIQRINNICTFRQSIIISKSIISYSISGD